MKDYELSVDVSYRCPFDCSFCSTPYNKMEHDMSLDLVRKILDFVQKTCSQDVKQRKIAITGGEPLLLNALPQCVLTWSSKLNDTILCTTAALKKDFNYWQLLKNNGLKTARISMHSRNHEKCYKIYGDNYSIATVDKNIELMKLAGINLEINLVLSKLNTTGFDLLWEYCSKNDIRKIRVLGLCKQGKAVHNWGKLFLPVEEEKLIVEDLMGLSVKHKIKVEFSGLPNHKICSHSNEEGACLGGQSFFHIDTGGNIYPCPSVKAIKKEQIGSVMCLNDYIENSSAFLCRSSIK